MLRLFQRTQGIYHPLVYGLATIIVLFLGKLWPDIEFGLWTVFLAVIGIHLYIELRKPVNYTSMAVSDDAIEYVALGQREVIRFDEITNVKLVRERAAFDAGIESKWIIHTSRGRWVEVMDEWPDRKRLLRVFRRRLPGFDAGAARRGHRAWREGVWACFESQAKP